MLSVYFEIEFSSSHSKIFSLQTLEYNFLKVDSNFGDQTL